ncbi:flagellar filament capping protein FliD [Bordetella genomosp. 12]|uniref:Flagellar hook-associated protein 2 n=1 Tax=Bordetella genomosp. 12 TaxID=463035 RepID=A0A261VKU4_9BORD|nr:flagellar filament capping protein FliD [Bordetella genomosp. 12]OZI74699.1 flagellar hook protein FliD [Bordetella genomosp. 12]
MATISSLGSSGLPLQDTLDKLQAAEEQRLTLITNQQTSAQTRISAFGKIQSAVETLQKAASDLTGMTGSNILTNKVTGDGVTSSIGTGATAGTYNIKVTQLATAQSLQTQAYSSRVDSMGTGGTVTFTINGEEKSVTLGTDTSLNGIVKAINGDDSLGLSATVVNDGNNNYYLMVSSNTEGTKAAVSKIAVTGNDTLAATLQYDASDSSSPMTVLTAAKDAQLSINGIAVTSQTNTVTTAIDGITLNLTAVTATGGNGATLTISQDNSKVTTLVQSFVNAYNSLQSTIADLTAFSVADETQSALTGDGTARNIQSAVAAALQVATGEGTVQNLGQLGITINSSTGQLSLDSEKFTKALNENPNDVLRVFAGTNGVASKMGAATDKMLGTNGSIKTRTDGLNKTLETLKKQYESTESQIEATMANYRTQFVKLDALVVQLKSTSEYLTQQFAALTSSSD